ncbi:MAG TPA: amino acid adenylation domain-containing protein, partial [Longimicrobiaceae bacterium]
VEMPLPRNGGGWRARGEPGGGAVSPDNLAYVIYTSGSTGTPKGVLVTHRGVVNYLSWFDREVLGAEGFELPLVSRLSFDAHVRQLFPPLLRGEAVRVLPEETVADPRALLAEISGRGRASFGGVPSLWSAMVELVRSGEAPRPEGVKAVLLGGEALSDELVERTRALFPDAAVWNHYGPTEATVNTTAARVDGAERVDIGRPIANVRVYLLDASGGPVPVGVPGELCVGGAGVARGYLGRPELTAERFVPDPFAGEPGARMYRSGDRARWLAQGRLEYAGRVDEQVKVRGFRIEPGEIEAVLERHPAVREAVVVVREDRLVGYVVAESGAVASPPELRGWLAERLPEYMVPSAVVVLETLPLTPNGKVDRRALTAPEPAPDGAGHAAPRTPAEEIVAGAFAEVLRAERVGVDQDFFALGGHSLLATRVVARIRSALGVELPLRALFEAPTAAGVAERVDALLREGAGVAAPPLVPVPRDGALPLSFAQQRLWLIDRLQPGSAAYNVPAALRVRGALDVAALERSLAEVVRRHETLRTVFGETDGEPVQTVRDPAPVPVAVTDLRVLPADRRDGEARRLAAAEAARPFDLGEGPLLRAALLRLDEEEWALLFTLHHVVSDGWSTGVLVAEVSELYTALTEGREPVLPSLPVQYADYAVWQREWLSGEVLDRQLGWWRERLAGAPPLLELPTDRPRPRVQGAHGGRVAFELPPETSRGLRALSRAEGATLFMTLLAAWQILLARWAGTEDVSVGTPIAGRGRVETEPLIGFFVNTLVLRTEPEGSLSFRGLLERVRETTLGAYQHQELPFERLVEELAPQRTLAHTPLFQVMLALQNNERGELRMGGLEVEPLDAGGEGAAKFDLTLAMGEDGERLGGTLSYRAELWDAATVERMAGHFRVLLEAAAAGPDARCDHLPLLTAAERRALTESRDETAEPRPAGATLHGLVAARAAAHPDAAAVVAAGGDEVVTFGGLEARAGRLAGRLRRLGVGPDVRVAVLMERAPETVVALLAVLGAGGAYVPLDPSYPAARLGFMLEDSGAAVLLSHRGLAERLPPHAAAVVELDGEGFGGEGGAGDAPEVAVSPDNLAYVVYTSGSTGTPKGVAVPHRAVVNYLEWARRAYLPGGGAGAPVHSPLAFDLTVTSLWAPLAAGERVVLAPETEPVEALAAVLRAQGGFGVVKLTPAHLELLAGQLTPEEAARCARLFVVGGEALPAETVAAWARLAPE